MNPQLTKYQAQVLRLLADAPMGNAKLVYGTMRPRVLREKPLMIALNGHTAQSLVERKLIEPFPWDGDAALHVTDEGRAILNRYDEAQGREHLHGMPVGL